jgi:hypothetical protein
MQRCSVVVSTIALSLRSHGRPRPSYSTISLLIPTHLLEADLINYCHSHPLFPPRLLYSPLPSPHILHFHPSFSFPPLRPHSPRVLYRHGPFTWLARARSSYTPANRTLISSQPFFFPIRRPLQTHIANFPHCKALLQCLSHHHVMYALTLHLV